MRRIGKNADFFEQVENHHGLENVEFEVALSSGKGDRRVKPDDLGADHGHGFTLGRIDFAGHDGRARFVFRKDEFPESAAGAACEPADVVCDFHHCAGARFDCGRGGDNCIVRGEHGEFVRRRHEREPGLSGDFFRRFFRESFRSVESGSDGCSAEREFIEFGECRFDALDGEFDLGNVSGELLSEGQRNSVLKVGASDFYDRHEFIALDFEFFKESFECGQKLADDHFRRGNVHRSREGVVRGLRHIDVVVRMNGLFCAFFAAEQFVCTVGDHLVDVHIALGSASGHPDFEGELSVIIAVEDFIACAENCGTELFGEESKFKIGFRRSFFNENESADDFERNEIVSDIEMEERTLSLRSPVLVCRNLNGSHAVAFQSEHIEILSVDLIG